MKKIGVIATHPIQYFNELFIELSKRHKLVVFYAHQQTPEDEIDTPLGISFKWSENLLAGYNFLFLKNRAKNKNVNNFFGCNNPQIFKEISQGQFDFFIVSGWHSLAYIQTIIACKIYQVPVYIRTDSTLDQPRSLFKKIFKSILYPALLKIPTGFLYAGERSKLFLLKYKVKDKKLFFFPHSASSKNFYSEKKIKKNNKKLIHKTLKILSVSALIKLKKVDDLIKACNKISELGYKIELNIVGSGDMQKELMELSKSFNLNVKFSSFVNQNKLRDYYISSDVLVLASNSESWGLVVNEAMQCGLPVVVSDSVGCGPDLIKENTGRIFKTGDVSDCAYKIIEVIKSEKINSNNILRHIEKFSVNSSIDTLENLLS